MTVEELEDQVLEMHIELLREPDPPQITEGPMKEVIKLLEER